MSAAARQNGRPPGILLCAVLVLFPAWLGADPVAGWSDRSEEETDIGGEEIDPDPMEDELLDRASGSLLVRVTSEATFGGTDGKETEKWPSGIRFTRNAVETRSVYRSTDLDAAFSTGTRKAAGAVSAERYMSLSIATPWVSAGRLDPPYLYRALATGFITSADLDRMSPEPPLLIRSDLPSFTTSGGVMNRLALHPFGDPLMVWAGSAATGEREAALFIRIRPASCLSIEALAATAAPASEYFGESTDSWFPEDGADRPLRTAGAAFRAALYTHAVRLSASLLASCGPFAEPGAAWSAQLEGAAGPIALRVRAGSASERFRQLVTGLPASLFAADGRISCGDTALLGLSGTASIALKRRALFPAPIGTDTGGSDDSPTLPVAAGPAFAPLLRPGPGRPGRERWSAAAHVGPERLRLTIGGRLSSEWDSGNPPLHSQRAEALLAVAFPAAPALHRSNDSGAGSDGEVALFARLRSRIDFAEWKRDRAEYAATFGIAHRFLEGRATATISRDAESAAELAPRLRLTFDGERFALSILAETTHGILLEPPGPRQRRQPLSAEGLPLRLTVTARVQ